MNPRIEAEFTLITEGQSCLFCLGGRGDGNKGVILTGVLAFRGGEIGLCQTCITHLGRMIGMIPADEANEIIAAAELMRIDRDRALVGLANMQEALDALRSAADLLEAVVPKEVALT